MWAKDGVVVVAIPEVTRAHELTDVSPQVAGGSLAPRSGDILGDWLKVGDAHFFH